VTRYLGVGGMLVGAWSLFKLRKSLLGGITAGLEAYKARPQGLRGEPSAYRAGHADEYHLILIGLSIIPLFGIFWYFLDQDNVDNAALIGAVMSVVVVIAGFLFSAVASYMAGLVGSSDNPVSGIRDLDDPRLLAPAARARRRWQAGPVAAI
jgi:putative OPT family oligopeptide transporter